MRRFLLLVGVGAMALPASCGKSTSNPLGAQTYLVPARVTIAAGAKHDVLAAACRNELSLSDLLLNTATIGLMTVEGRIDGLLAIPSMSAVGCEPVDYALVGAAVQGDPALTLASAPDGGRVLTVASTGPGATTLTATLRVGDELLAASGTITALQADRVDVLATCRHGGWGMAGLAINDLLLPTDTDVSFSTWIKAGTRPLAGYDYFPVELQGLTLVQRTGGLATLRTASQPGPTRMRSLLDAGVSLAGQLYTPASIDALECRYVGVPQPRTAGPTTCYGDDVSCVFGRLAQVGDALHFRAFARVGGESPCVDALPRTFTSLTPDVCSASAQGSSAGPVSATGIGDVTFYARAPGACRVRAELVGRGLSSVAQAQVASGWQLIAAPDSGTSAPMVGLWGTGPRDLFCAGWSEVRQFDGTAWVTHRPPGRAADAGLQELLADVWGSAPGGVYVVGSRGYGAHFDGGAWAALPSGVSSDFTAVWGSGPGDVFLVGKGGTIVHHDGAAFRALDSGTSTDLVAVWGSGPRDVYAAGYTEGPLGDGGRGAQLLLRYDGTGWRRVEAVHDGLAWPRSASAQAPSIWGTGPGDVWVADEDELLHFDGGSWSRSSGGGTLLTGTSPTNLFLSRRGGVWHFDGQHWTDTRLDRLAPGSAPAALWGAGGDLFATVRTSPFPGVFRFVGAPADGG